ncbi:hypothetical protein F4604DRAFT_620055 [Suillus subluteus]|nr:hypothetical protein F4604DRAFT_620055 [Suillus subluteus]
MAQQVNNWSIRHPYVAAGALICISANPDILLTPLRICLYVFGFSGHGIAKGTFQSINYRCLMTLNTNMIDSSSRVAEYYNDLEEMRLVEGDFSVEALKIINDDLEVLRLADADDENRDFEVRSMLAHGVSWLSAIGAVFVLGRTRLVELMGLLDNVDNV